MYIIRDIFHLKFGHYREVKPLLQEEVDMFTSLENDYEIRVLSDFTGDNYRIIIEESFPTLAEYEEVLKLLTTPEWQEWYAKFKPHIRYSQREILKRVI